MPGYQYLVRTSDPQTTVCGNARPNGLTRTEVNRFILRCRIYLPHRCIGCKWSAEYLPRMRYLDRQKRTLTCTGFIGRRKLRDCSVRIILAEFDEPFARRRNSRFLLRSFSPYSFYCPPGFVRLPEAEAIQSARSFWEAETQSRCDNVWIW